MSIYSHLGRLLEKVHVSLVKLMVTKPQQTGGQHGHPNCSSLLPV
jgi:hypothetical protein